MAKAGPFLIPDFDPKNEAIDVVDATDPAPVDLPPRAVLDAGVARFREIANLHWPNRKGDGLITFDVRNPTMLYTILGLVYQSMREADRA